MYKLNQYLQDGANYQARAVLAYLEHDGIEESWNDEHKQYDAKPEIARWENCREQGYIVSMRSKTGHKQINIAFFEHRNSDSICAIEWEQASINSLTIDTAKFQGVYKNKYDVSHSENYGECLKMATWIWDRLIHFWKTNQQKETTKNDI